MGRGRGPSRLPALHTHRAPRGQAAPVALTHAEPTRRTQPAYRARTPPVRTVQTAHSGSAHVRVAQSGSHSLAAQSARTLRLAQLPAAQLGSHTQLAHSSSHRPARTSSSHRPARTVEFAPSSSHRPVRTVQFAPSQPSSYGPARTIQFAQSNVRHAARASRLASTHLHTRDSTSCSTPGASRRSPPPRSPCDPCQATGASMAGTPAVDAPVATAPEARNRLPLLFSCRRLATATPHRTLSPSAHSRNHPEPPRTFDDQLQCPNHPNPAPHPAHRTPHPAPHPTPSPPPPPHGLLSPSNPIGNKSPFTCVHFSYGKSLVDTPPLFSINTAKNAGSWKNRRARHSHVSHPTSPNPTPSSDPQRSHSDRSAMRAASSSRRYRSTRAAAPWPSSGTCTAPRTDPRCR